MEFANEDSVSKLLAIKEAGVKGAWISFHKWSHNVNVYEILQDQESSIIFTAIFPGLRKEWSVEYMCIMDVFTLSPWTTLV